MNTITEAIVTVLLMIGGIALASVLVSKNANTTGVITASGNAFSNALGVAVSPVTGTTNSYSTAGSNTFPIG